MIYVVVGKLSLQDSVDKQLISNWFCVLNKHTFAYNGVYDSIEIPTKQCKVIIHRPIEDSALQKWNIDISTSSMCRMYRLFKKQLDFDSYLLHSNYMVRIIILS